jgi:DNA topoisomerase-3
LLLLLLSNSILILSTIIRAMHTLRRPNPFDNDAVNARREIDLRLGAIFTRYQTMTLAKAFTELDGELLSYGTRD